RANEAAVKVEHQVVALIEAERCENPIPATHQLGEDYGLGAIANLDRMIAERWRVSESGAWHDAKVSAHLAHNLRRSQEFGVETDLFLLLRSAWIRVPPPA